jgi:sugar-specific transcriptional regulator TrmB
MWYTGYMNERILSNIKNIGLTDKEVLVYATLAERGGAYPSKIAEVTKLNRSTVYKTLLELSIKDLVNEIEKKNKLYYQIDKPQKLVRYAKDKVQMAKEQLEKAERALPELEGLFSMVSNKPKVLFFEGPDTILNICNDMVGGVGNYEMLAFSNAKKFKNYMPPKQLRDFVKSKERLKISTRAIVPDTKEDRGYNEAVFKGVKKPLWPEIRFIEKELFPFEAELTIYGTNKVSITKLGSENIIGVIIEDDIIHGMMKMIFNLAWKSAGK